MAFYVGNSDDIGVGKTVFGSRRHVLGEFWAQRDRWLQGRPLRQGNTEKNSHNEAPSTRSGILITPEISISGSL
jgi:hypothetical protein